MADWVFAELGGAAVRRDPNEAELFKTEQTDEGEYAGNDALVREVLQNSLDARSGTDAVHVRMAVHDPGDAPPVDQLAGYFARLEKPLRERDVKIDRRGCPDLPCRFLVCEDFGTRGLEGDPLRSFDPPAGSSERDDFYWFWRNMCRSGKTGEDLGRWGLGKTVYRAASRVGCMFGLTVRRSDARKLLMGQAVLKSHEDGGKIYAAEGYWCNDCNQQGLPLPMEDAGAIDAFRRQWHLERTNEPGLSVVVPYVGKELKGERLLEAVAVHFFTRILRGNLVVDVRAANLGEVRLDRSTIGDVCAGLPWNGPKRTKRHASPPIALANECLQTSPGHATELLGTKRLPDIDETSFPAEELPGLRRSFMAGELLGIRVRISLPRAQGEPQEGEARVYMRRLGDGKRYDSYFVREGMTITKINSTRSLLGVQGLVLVNDGPLSTLLGDTEGPAHEDWDTSSERPNHEWKAWKGRVKFVQRIVNELAELFTPPSTEVDRQLLSDFFSIEKAGSPHPKPKPGEEHEGNGALPAITGHPKWFQIAARAGGFTVSRVNQSSMPDAPVLRVAVAYDLPKGDPVRKWSPLDFTIGQDDGHLAPQGHGTRVRLLQGNIVQLYDLADDFSFRVDGFDRHRDLYVRVDDLSTEEATDA